MPERKKFNSVDDYYSTLFHELAHSTGHESRLDRKNITEESVVFGSGDYGKEELVAEISAAFLCGFSNIETTIENSAAYIDGWRRTIRANKRLVVHAAGAAQRAVDFIMSHNNLIDYGV